MHLGCDLLYHCGYGIGLKMLGGEMWVRNFIPEIIIMVCLFSIISFSIYDTIETRKTSKCVEDVTYVWSYVVDQWVAVFNQNGEPEKCLSKQD